MEERKNNSCNNNMKEERIDDMEYPVHSQVRKIKQESGKTIIDRPPGQPEMRPVFKDFTRQLSRSPLGLAGRPISVGDS